MAITITKPVVNGSSGTWGTILNQALDDIVTGVNGNVPTGTVTAKGDLLVATASGAVARQAVGSNGQVLTADSTQTNGVKWASAGSSGMSVVANYAALPTGSTGMMAYTTDTNTMWTYGTYSGSGVWVPMAGSVIASLINTAGQNYATSGTYYAQTWTGYQMVASTYASYGGWSSSTNPTRFTVPYPGWWEFTGSIGWDQGAAGQRVTSYRKNGVGTPINGTMLQWYNSATSGAVGMPTVNMVISLAAGDYIEMYGAQFSGGAITTSTSTGWQPHMSVKYLGLNGQA